MLTSRRQWLATLSTAGAVCMMTSPVRATAAAPFRYSFNTATIRGQKLPLEKEIDAAGKAGYDAFEPWIEKLEQHAKSGKSFADLRKRIADYGMTVESAIGFPAWIAEDEAKRRKGLEDAKRAMDLVSQLGGKRLAAPPVGATDSKDSVDLRQATDRYRLLLELGDQMGVVPQVEVWGFSKTLSHLGEAALVAIESQHPKACVLADVYHLYKGGSGFAGLKLLAAAGLQVFHMNDYPNLERAQIADKDRVYPGDGVAPLKEVLRSLIDIGFRGVLSLELFNPEYYKHDPFEVARTGLAKMKAVAELAAAR